MAAELPQQKAGGGLARRLVRLLRRKRSTSGSVAGGGEYDESSMDSSINSLSKLKLSAAKLDVLFRSAAQPRVPGGGRRRGTRSWRASSLASRR